MNEQSLFDTLNLTHNTVHAHSLLCFPLRRYFQSAADSWQFVYRQTKRGDNDYTQRCHNRVAVLKKKKKSLLFHDWFSLRGDGYRLDFISSSQYWFCLSILILLDVVQNTDVIDIDLSILYIHTLYFLQWNHEITRKKFLNEESKKLITTSIHVNNVIILY